MQILEPARNVLAFYDGRNDGQRFMAEENWVDQGALSLGIASYALIDGEDALVYDTHVSVPHATQIRAALTERGVKRITVVLSHWHLDHVAGTEAFSDCRIIANEKTAAHLDRHRAAIEGGTHSGPPAINPLVPPTETFSGMTAINIGGTAVELIEANIHSDDATVLWLPEQELMLAGDTMEDTVTYVCEPENFDTHLSELDRMWALRPDRILPNHGDPDIIQAGGYERTLIRAQQQYLRMLKRARDDEELRHMLLADVIRGPLEAGWVHLYAPYEAIHAQNIGRVLDLGA
jgi:cyclase